MGITLLYALAGHVLRRFRPQWRLTPFLLVLVCIYFTGNGAFIYETF